MSVAPTADQMLRGEPDETPRHVRLKALGVAVTAGLVIVFMFTPRFVVWRGMIVARRLPFPEIHRAFDTLYQLQDLWAPADSHSNAVLAWRLLFPGIWYYGQLPALWFFALPFIGCVVTLWLVAWLNYRRLESWRLTWLATALFAALPWFFVSTGWLAYFDSWLMMGLLVVGFVPSRVALGLTCLLTPWIDERFVLALPVAIAVRLVALGYVEDRNWRAALVDLAVIVAASVPYPAIRAISWWRGDPGSSGYIERHWNEVQSVPVSRFLEGLWSGFRVSWLLIGAALCFTAQRLGARWGFLFAVLVIASSVASLFVAADMSRSLIIETPVMLLGIWLWGDLKLPRYSYVLSAILAANLLLPAAHVVWPFKIPIRYLYTEIDRYREPPVEFAADTYFQAAKMMREKGDRAEAERNYEIAIRLDHQFAPAYLGRASIRLEEGNVDDALADLETALKIKPDLPDALLMRAAIRRSRGEIFPAIEDLREALATAPADWPFREQTQSFLNDMTPKLSAPPPKESP
ncbi:MAG TPA: tetratricopeptide repeat protein [Pirellulales bacterium]